ESLPPSAVDAVFRSTLPPRHGGLAGCSWLFRLHSANRIAAVSPIDEQLRGRAAPPAVASGSLLLGGSWRGLLTAARSGAAPSPRRGPASMSGGGYRAPRGEAPGWFVNSAAIRSLARMFRVLDLLDDLIEVPALRGLKGRELSVALELLEPQQLADGQHVPVVDIARHRPGERTAII